MDMQKSTIFYYSFFSNSFRYGLLANIGSEPRLPGHEFYSKSQVPVLGIAVYHYHGRFPGSVHEDGGRGIYKTWMKLGIM